jgi:hypothetical protein
MPKAKIFLLVIFSAILFYILLNVFQNLDIGRDWRLTYRPAATEMLHGRSPYNVTIFYAAPWSLIPLLPFALLPYNISNICIFFLGLFTFAYTAHKLGASPPSMIIFLTSAPVIGCLLNGNIEWLPLLGIILPAPVGLIFAVTKPQVGIGIVVYWFIHIYRTKGLLSVVKTFTPVTLLTLVSFWMYGFWILGFQRTLEQSAVSSYAYNVSVWPYGIFAGLWLLYKSIQKEKPRTAMAASPFLSPYALQYTWVAVLTGVIHAPLELLAVSIGLWIPVALRFIR